jgi:VanZ family protein
VASMLISEDKEVVMRHLFIVTIVISLSIITINTLIQMGNVPSFEAVYTGETSVLFFLDANSSFYDLYSFREGSLSFLLRKLGHFVTYGFLAFVIFLTTPIDKLLLRGLLAISSASVIGLIDEIHQHFLMSRSGRLLDVYINSAGAIIFVLVTITIYVLLISLRIKQHEQKKSL